MPFVRQRPDLHLTSKVYDELVRISKSRTEKASRVERAKMLLLYHDGVSISAIARELSTNRPKVERCVDKALQLGALSALDDLPRPGRPPTITPEAKTWVINLACKKPKELGYSFELWTHRLLAEYIRNHCIEAGYPCLKKISRGTISKILQKSNIRPHNIKYYLERRDPEFDQKMVQVLHVYKEVELIRGSDKEQPSVAVISYDEKPGIQAISTVAPDLPPVIGKYSCVARDYEYRRHGTVSLLAGIDLLTGRIHGMVENRHRSREFVKFLKLLDQTYPKGIMIRIILDNHSAHVSKETRGYLATVPNRFELIFTPKHGSWLNIIECLFAKMAKTFLRAIRVDSKEELKQRILQWLKELNESPVIFRWKYGLDAISIN